MRSVFRLSSLPWLLLAFLAAACGAGSGNSATVSSATPPAVGWNGEVDDAPYVAYERVSYERLPKERLTPGGEVRLPVQVRRISAFRLRESESHAIRFTDDAGKGWLAWQPSIVLIARQRLAQESRAQPSRITTLGVWRMQWPDACLGVRDSTSSCAAEATPGFRVSLRLGATTFTFHTDLRDRVVAAPA